MKIIKTLIVMGFFAALLSCDKNNTKIYNRDVETYIELLQTNQYEASILPEFSSNEIPTLLQFIHDNSVVNKFPHNPISSYAPPNPEYRLGVLVLWTIESIRVTACNDKHIFGFPSQHPFVQTKSEPTEWIINHNDVVYDTIKVAYFNWWNDNKNKKFSNFCNIDPLENTNYSWH